MKKYNVLITGNLDRSAWNIVETLEAGECEVTVAGKNISPEEKRFKNKYFDVSKRVSDLAMIYKSGHFHTVVFVFSCKSELLADGFDERNRIASFIDDMRANIGLICEHPEVEQFILITDQRVFGAEQDKTEHTYPEPDTAMGRVIALAEEEFLQFKGRERKLKRLLIRTTHIYSPGAIDDFITDFDPRRIDDKISVFLPGNKDTLCDFLSVNDLARFLLTAIAEDSDGTMHLTSPKAVSYEIMAQWLENFDIESVYADIVRTPLLSGSRAFHELEFVPYGHFMDEITIAEEKKEKRHLLKRFFSYLNRRFKKLLPWAETLIGAVLMQLCVYITEINAVVRFLDVRLLYVVVIGSVHGSFFGWIAGIVATVSYCISHISDASESWPFLLNMDNWLPLVLYILVGGITGYVKSQHVNDNRELELALERREEDLEYLRGVHRYTCDQRDMLMEQVIKSRDSYGKVFSMVNDLNSTYPDEILFSALNIFEDVLANNSITFYVRIGKSPYLRKLVESEGIQETPSSPRLDDYSDISDNVTNYTLYTNSQFTPNLPVYCMPLKLSEDRDFIIMLWKVSPSQYTKYYQNLIVIMSNLTRMSLERALDFQSSPDRYVPGTGLLKQDEFIRSWQIRREMKQRHVGYYRVLRFSSSLPDDVLCDRLEGIVRALDIPGRMDDGKRYILLTQAEEQSESIIINRFRAAGISADAVNEHELEAYIR